MTKVYSNAPRSSGPAGRPSQSECLISYFWFSYFVATVPPPSFLDLLPEPTPFPRPPPRPASPSRSLSVLSAIELDLHRAIGRTSAKARAVRAGSVLAANSYALGEIRYREPNPSSLMTRFIVIASRSF